MAKVKLSTALNLISFLSLLIPIILIGGVAVKFTYDYVTLMTLDHNKQVAQNVAGQINGMLDNPETSLVSAREVFLRLRGSEALTPRDILKIVAIINAEMEGFDHFSLLDSQGFVVGTSPYEGSIQGLSFSQNSVYKALKEDSSRAVWSDIYVSNLHGVSSIDLGVSVGDYMIIGTIHVDRIREQLARLNTKDSTIIAITDAKGIYVAHNDYHLVEQRVTDPLVNQNGLPEQGDTVYNGVKSSYAIYRMPKIGWSVIVYDGYNHIVSEMQRFLSILGLIMLISFIGVVSVSTRNNHRITRHFSNMIKNLQDVAAGNYQTIASSDIYAEFDDIISAFNRMVFDLKTREDEINAHREEMIALNEELEQRVEDRTNKLIRTNLSLEKTLENLKNTQQQLVESEKLASLGGLVAGIAHEINTPIGVTMTAITYLMEEGKLLQQHFQEETLTKEELKEYFDVFSEGTRIIEKNMQKASELIRSFKMMAVDQSNTDVREFDMGHYIKEVLFSLEPKIKKAKVEVIYEITEGIMHYANPGDVSQVITNLVMNALIHGFHQKIGGKLTLRVNQVKQLIHIDVTDNGVGIPEEHIHAIFEPFYTTKRGQGGTGLGLNIVHTIVTQKLKGSIRCISEVGVGTTFQVRIPINKEVNSLQTPMIRQLK